MDDIIKEKPTDEWIMNGWERPLKNKKLIFLWFFIGLSFMKKIITKNFDL